MANPFRFSNKAGFGLMEAMIASGVVGILIFAIVSMFSQMNRGSKALDIKAQVQSFDNLIRLYTSKDIVCRRTFGIQYDSTLNPPVIIDAPAGDWKIIDPVTLPTSVSPTAPTRTFLATLPPAQMPGILLASQLFLQGVNYQDLTVSRLGMTIDRWLGANTYSARIFYDLSVRNPQAVSGPPVYVRDGNQGIEMIITLAPHPGGLMQLGDCLNAGGAAPLEEAPALCQRLGGRYLENKLTGPNPPPPLPPSCDTTKPANHYFPNPRCNLTQVIELAVNEWPALNCASLNPVAPGVDPTTVSYDVPKDGGPNQEGERVESCFYQSAGTVKEFRCGSGFLGRKSRRCRYDINDRKWKITYYNAGGTVDTVKSPAPNYGTICTHGVKISREAPGREFLDWDETLCTGLNYNNPGYCVSNEFPDFNGVPRNSPEEMDNIYRPVACNVSANAEAWRNCSNYTNPESAKNGAVGSCVYARGGKIWHPSWSSAADRTNFLNNNGHQIPVANLENYTGWLMVQDNLHRRMDFLSGAARVVEARGLPCASVEIDTSNYTPQNGAAYYYAGPDTDRAKFLGVKECRVTAQNWWNNGGPISQIVPCDNSNLAEAPDGFAMAGTLEGDGILMGRGNCVYFQRVKLASYAKADQAGKSTTLAPGNTGDYYTGNRQGYFATWNIGPPIWDASVPFVTTPTVSDHRKEYTGWVWLSAPLPGRYFRPTNGAVKLYSGFGPWYLGMNGVERDDVGFSGLATMYNFAQISSLAYDADITSGAGVTWYNAPRMPSLGTDDYKVLGTNNRRADQQISSVNNNSSNTIPGTPDGLQERPVHAITGVPCNGGVR